MSAPEGVAAAVISVTDSTVLKKYKIGFSMIPIINTNFQHRENNSLSEAPENQQFIERLTLMKQYLTIIS